jgi:DNA polymerase I-like protein with 3'-5' exonuclease and polymerase domains
MRVVIDIETNSLVRPSKIWLIVCKDVDTGELYVWRNVSDNPTEAKSFLDFASRCTYWVGHNVLGYDFPVLYRLLDLPRVDIQSICDTLVVSKLVDYSRQGHSIEDYGLLYGLEKIKFNDFKQYSREMEEYCVRDIDISHRVYVAYAPILASDVWKSSLLLEHQFQELVNDLHDNGFAFDTEGCRRLLVRVESELAELDKEIHDAFPPKLTLEREVNPVLTKHGTLHRKDFRWVENGDLSEFNGGPFCKCRWQDFNPSSHTQIINVLNSAGWKPINKTKTHIETERELNKLKYHPRPQGEVALTKEVLYNKIQSLSKYGWKIDEDNLATLPSSAPPPARSLAKRILLESRRRTLTEWLNLVSPIGRIHGKFYGIGAWTHRMAHQNPNTANIPLAVNVHDGSTKLYGRELRELWRVPKNRLLVGVDAESIQLRVFAHYINDPAFTKAIVEGKKSDKSDPHSFNQKVFGPCCKTRQASKHSLYAIFFGGGPVKIAEIMGCTRDEASEAMDNLARRYSGLSRMKDELFPEDARRGYFIGLDGRHVKIPGDTVGQRKHLCMSGYLQNGEAVIMKKAALLWYQQLDAELKLERWKKIASKDPFLFVNMVHDEWQTEVPNNMDWAIRLAQIQAESLRIVGEELGLNCPLAGSYWNDDHNDYTIGVNWYQTH